MKLNVPNRLDPVHNNEGALAKHINPTLMLRRSLMACMLWEDSFYESGEDIAKRIKDLVPLVKAETVYAMAVEARTKMKLRHAPLLLAAAMAAPNGEQRHVVADTIAGIVQRPDELAEFLAVYCKVWGYAPGDVRKHVSAQVKRGLARAFAKFGEYALAKYDRDGAIKLRDVLFLCHSKPSDAPDRKYTRDERKRIKSYAEARETLNMTPLSPGEKIYAKLVDGELSTPDTWEVTLSGGADKKGTFERLIAERKLGALALLRNLRNMHGAGVPKMAVTLALTEMDAERVLPFRFIAAARAVPQWEDIVEAPMLRCLGAVQKLAGKTVLLIDTSPSMDARLSARSELNRKDAANGLAILLREICDDVEVWAFAKECAIVPSRRGFALADAVLKAVPLNGTLLGRAIRTVSGRYDRLIVVTDEESQDPVGDPDHGKSAFMINVSSSRNGVGYGKWTHVDGWSEAIVDYVRAIEAEPMIDG